MLNDLPLQSRPKDEYINMKVRAQEMVPFSSGISDASTHPCSSNTPYLTIVYGV